MTINYEAGQVIEGKVTGIKPYGAFVALDEEIQGLVHISEVTDGFVNDINDYLSVGQKTKVKVLQVDEENNKVSLSIRKTEEKPKQQAQTNKTEPSRGEQESAGFNTLKDKLEDWIHQSSDREQTFKK